MERANVLWWSHGISALLTSRHSVVDGDKWGFANGASNTRFSGFLMNKKFYKRV